MIIIIKSAPDTTDGALGLTIAKESGADLILLQNGVYFAQKERLSDFSRTVYILDDDKRLRGLKPSEMDDRVKTIGYDKMTDLITSGKKVIGMF
jgi:sulfur relay protein TusB/DsrH